MLTRACVDESKVRRMNEEEGCRPSAEGEILRKTCMGRDKAMHFLLPMKASCILQCCKNSQRSAYCEPSINHKHRHTLLGSTSSKTVLLGRIFSCIFCFMNLEQACRVPRVTSLHVFLVFISVPVLAVAIPGTHYNDNPAKSV